MRMKRNEWWGGDGGCRVGAKELSLERTLPAITPLACTVTVTVSCCSKQAFANANADAEAGILLSSSKDQKQEEE